MIGSRLHQTAFAALVCLYSSVLPALVIDVDCRDAKPPDGSVFSLGEEIYVGKLDKRVDSITVRGLSPNQFYQAPSQEFRITPTIPGLYMVVRTRRVIGPAFIVDYEDCVTYFTVAPCPPNGIARAEAGHGLLEIDVPRLEAHVAIDGTKSVVPPITLKNVGTSPLQIYGIQEAFGQECFSVEVTNMDQISYLPAGESRTMLLNIDPKKGDGIPRYPSDIRLCLVFDTDSDPTFKFDQLNVSLYSTATDIPSWYDIVHTVTPTPPPVGITPPYFTPLSPTKTCFPEPTQTLPPTVVTSEPTVSPTTCTISLTSPYPTPTATPSVTVTAPPTPCGDLNGDTFLDSSDLLLMILGGS